MPKFKVQVQLDYTVTYTKYIDVEITAEDASTAEEQAADDSYSKEFLDLENCLDPARKNWEVENDNAEVTVVDCEPISPEEDEEEPTSD
jgi:hypothetical protein